MAKLRMEALVPACGIREVGGDVGWVTKDFRDLRTYLQNDICLSTSLVRRIAEDNYEYMYELINSIPSPFARLWFYYLILSITNENKLKRIVIQEMRDIWMILAFKEELKLNVTYDTIRLDNENGFTGLMSRYLVDTEHFRDKELKIILLENKPVAIISPFTLIAPAANYRSIVPVKVLRDNLKRDPLWKAALIKYLEHIIMLLNINNKYLVNLDDEEAGLNPINVLERYLRNEIESLRDSIKNEKSYTQNIEVSDFPNFPRMSVRIEEALYDSDFVISSQEKTKKTIVIIPKEELQERFVRIYNLINSYLYVDIVEHKDNNKVLASIYKKLRNEEYNVAFFSTDDIIEDNIITYKIGSKTYYFHPFRVDFIKKIIQTDIYSFVANSTPVLSNREITFAFPNEKNGRVLVRKSVNVVEMQGIPPAILVYPYNTGKEYLWYVVLLRHRKEDNRLYLHDINNNNGHGQILSFEEMWAHIHPYKEKPYFFAVSYGSDKIKNVILIPQTEPSISLARLQHIALLVDIGTSNTTFGIVGVDRLTGQIVKLLYHELIGEYIAVLPHRDIISFVVNNKNSLTLNDLAALLFIPSIANGKNYTPTLFFQGYRIRGNKSLPFNDTGKPVIISNTMFSPDRLEALKKLVDISDTNIKWVDYEIDKRPTMYINSVFNLFAKPQRKDINDRFTLYYSHPTTANVDERFLGEYIGDHNVRIRGVSEYKALFAYFYSRYGGLISNSIILDVGGGSTEMVFWQDNDIRYSTSIRIGGNLILSGSLSTVIRAIGQENYPDSQKISDHINALFFLQKNSHLMKSITDNFLGGNDEYRAYLEMLINAKIYTLIFLSLWGYIQILNEETISDNRGIYIFLGGNMSKIMREIYNTELTNVVREMMAPTLQIKDSFSDIYYSEDPKLEIFLGMIDLHMGRIPIGYLKKINAHAGDYKVDILTEKFDRSMKALLSSLREHLRTFYRMHIRALRFNEVLNKIVGEMLERHEGDISRQIYNRIGYSIYPLNGVIKHILEIIFELLDIVFIQAYKENWG